jgi:hypothetical protein
MEFLAFHRIFYPKKDIQEISGKFVEFAWHPAVFFARLDKVWKQAWLISSQTLQV